MRMLLRTIALTLLILSIHGCGPSGHSVSQDEWDQLFGMPAETTKAASELVQRDAESRNQWLSLHEDLQTERSEIGRQRDLLEDDRRDWAAHQRSDPIIAAAISAAGLLAACSLPLILMALLLWPRKPEPASDRDAVCDILVDELVADALRIDRDPGERKRLEDSP